MKLFKAVNSSNADHAQVADAIGEILTAGPIKDIPPLPFGHYI
jgi:hypothetical protein